MEGLLPYALMILGPGGAAWVAIKVSLNGTRDDVREIKEDISELQSDVAYLKEEAAFTRGRREARDTSKG